jgi:hypothetical protein
VIAVLTTKDDANLSPPKSHLELSRSKCQDGPHFRRNDYHIPLTFPHYNSLLLPYFSWRNSRSDTGVHYWRSYGPGTVIL